MKKLLMVKTPIDINSPPGLAVDEMKGDVRTLARGAVVFTIGNVFGGLTNAAVQIFVARSLGPNFYGLYALGFVLLNIVRAYANFGLGRTAIAYGAQYWKEDDSRLARILRFTLQWSSLLAILFALPLFLFAQPIAVDIFKTQGAFNTIRIFAMIIPMLALMDTANSISLITRDTRYRVWSDQFLQPITSLVLIVVFVGLGWGFQGVLAATLISYLAAMVLALWFALRLFPEIRHIPPAKEPAAQEIFFFSVATILPGIFTTMISWGDRLVLGAIRPAVELGIYQSASQFSILFAMILGSVNAVFSPMIAAFHKKGETFKLDGLYKVTTKWAFYMALPVSIVTLLVPRLVLTVIFGAKFAPGALALQILTVGQLVNVVTGAVGMLLMMTGHARAWSISTFTALAGSIGLNLLLTPRMGIAGTAIGTGSALLVMFGMGIFQVRHYLHIWPYDRRYWKGLLAAAGSALAVAGLSMLSLPSPFLKLVLLSFTSLSVFVCLVLLLKLDSEDSDIIQAILSRFIRKK